MNMKYYQIMIEDDIIKVFKSDNVDDYINYSSDAPEEANIIEINENEYEKIIDTGRFYPVDDNGNPVDEIDGLSDTDIRLTIATKFIENQQLDYFDKMDEIYRWVRGFKMKE